jgi:hypothetical protein
MQHTNVGKVYIKVVEFEEIYNLLVDNISI